MRLRSTLLVVYVVIALGSLTGVLFRGAMTAEGLYLGLPAGLAWVSLWALLTFLVVALYHATGRGGSPSDGDAQ